MIDKHQAGEQADVILRNLLKVRQSAYLVSEDFGKLRADFIAEGLARLWDRLMSDCKGYRQECRLLVSEKALACLIRKGAHKSDIRMTYTKATVQLNNCTYYVNKEGGGCSAGPCGSGSFWCHTPMRWVALSGEDFADFMFDFDALVPDIIRKADKLLLEFNVRIKQYEILCQTVSQLSELILEPNGINCHLDTDFTESEIRITFNDGNHLSLYETIAIDHLADFFRSVPERMASQPVLPRIRHTLNWWEEDDIDVTFS